MIILEPSFQVGTELIESVALNRVTADKAAVAALKAIKSELPEETQTVEVLDYVLERMKDAIHSSRVSL